MKRHLQDFRFDRSEYERPDQDWICGWTEAGRPCHLGPDKAGHCRATFECTPFRKDDCWHCTRPGHRGGKCAEGPRPDGTCAHPIPTCQPKRSVRARRGALVGGAVALTAGLALFIFGGPYLVGLREAMISPGPLAAQHSAIDTCAACHTAAARSEAGAGGDMAGGAGEAGEVREAGAPAEAGGPPVTADVQGGSGPGGGAPVSVHGPGLEQTALCLSCHRATDESALQPHGLDPAERRAITARMDSLESRRVPLALLLAALGPDVPQEANGALACATCHEEHRGRDNRLAHMDNGLCQACHVVRFGGFSAGHPEFTVAEGSDDLPYRFDHAGHEVEYFLDEGAEFSCASCHTASSSGLAMGISSFESMCADCHEDEIRRDGMVVLQLPGVDYEILAEAGISVGEWPFNAGIDLDAPLSPLMRMLLSTDPDVAEALDRLEGAELSYLVGEDDATLEAAGRVVWGLKALLHELSTGGREALARRLEQALGTELTGVEVLALVDQRDANQPRSTEPGWLRTLRAAQEEWLPDLASELARHRAGRAVPLDERFDYAEPEAAPGWTVGFDMTIRYLPSGHGDVFLRRLAEASARGEGSGADALLAMLSDESAAGHCAACHTLAPDEADAATAGDVSGRFWLAAEGGTSMHLLTVFDHAPHLVKECQSCHAFGTEAGFEPITRDTCTSCHRPKMATESCLNCHRYHNRPFETRPARRMSERDAERPASARQTTGGA